MPIELQGSCHCGAVRFSVQSSTAVPFRLCFCSICRKVGGVGGSINLGGFADTLKIHQGQEHIKWEGFRSETRDNAYLVLEFDRVYNAVLNRDTPDEKIATDSDRNFCSKCSSMLWLFPRRWPQMILPFASAIDSPDLQPPETMVCIKLDSKPDYVRLPEGDKELYTGYAEDSLEVWHKKHNVFAE